MKNTMLKYQIHIIGLAMLLLPFIGRAQHGVSYNQFGQLKNTFNNSLSTMDEHGSFSVLGRRQWVGVDGAPKSVWASGNVKLRPVDMSVGVDFKQSSLGVVKESEATAFIAKAVRISEDEYLSLSMGGGLIYFQGNYSQLDGGDPSFRDNIRETNGILSISTSFYRKDRFYAGISIPRLSLIRDKNREYEFRNIYYATAGFLFQLDDAFHVRPSVLFTKKDDRDMQFDLSALVFMGKKIGLGMGLQSQGDLSALMQLNFGDFGLGYSYQFSPKSTTVNQRISNNTHEVGLRYRIGGIGML